LLGAAATYPKNIKNYTMCAYELTLIFNNLLIKYLPEMFSRKEKTENDEEIIKQMEDEVLSTKANSEFSNKDISETDQL
jgi:hypothetical protein